MSNGKSSAEEGATSVLTPAAAALAVTDSSAASALSKEEEQEAEQRWQERILFFKQQDKKAWESVLRLHWEKGQFLSDLSKNPRHYGSRTVESFAQSLEVSKESAYAYLRFFQRYTAEELEKAAEQKLPWRSIVYLLSVEDRNKREKLQLQVSKGKITPEELISEVKSLTKGVRKEAKAKGKKVDGRGAGNAVGTVLRTTTSVCVDLARKAGEFKDAVRQYRKLEDGKHKSELAIKLKEAWKAIGEVHSKLEDVLKLKEDK